MHDGIHVVAGECTTTFDGSRVREHEQRGQVLVVVKPDNTVLVHDAEGYQPVAWLTRAETVTIEGTHLAAIDGDQRLEVAIHEETVSGRYPASAAGTPVGECPDCGDALVRVADAVVCTGCDARHGLPGDAEVLDEHCDCGLPTMRVERGRAFEVCVDRECESMDEAVTEVFDREWDCPNCEGDLRILRRGGLLAGCEHYPDCDTGFAFPAGVVVEECVCGLPLFETAGGKRCLDATCEAWRNDSTAVRTEP
ncbi:endonuclease NucS domain-containing protein [Halorhabdus amylolytica]|uniref:endonuclease NucS domain-containing protein n=1 Tax=Halorhabdus amylolytica TaxID=2559573 RepID=UPI0010AB3D55|nr:endonuclease NucS domain-containing protein [Halorhabdus amylolytica]